MNKILSAIAKNICTILILSSTMLIGCGSSPSAAIGGLRPESELVNNLCNWPAVEFSPTNNTGGLFLGVKTGDTAVDFTLLDLSGEEVNLSALLQSKPVLLIFGSHT